MEPFSLKLEENPKDKNEIIIDTIHTDYDKCFFINYVKLRYSNFDGKANFPMFSLNLLVKDESVAVLRYDMALYHWKDLLAETEKIKATYKQGFYSHLGLGNPLKEFVGEDLEDFTYLGQLTRTIWIFAGNHEKVSGVFRYFLWKPQLIDTIKQKLKPEQIKPL